MREGWSLTAHPHWDLIRQNLRLEPVDGDTRCRIEVIEPESATARAWLLTTLLWPCVACGLLVPRIRQRRVWGTLYLAACCEVTDPRTVGCSRGSEAREEYDLIEDDLRHRPFPESQPPLFDFTKEP